MTASAFKESRHSPNRFSDKGESIPYKNGSPYSLLKQTRAMTEGLYKGDKLYALT
jgi:hypothetical protein